MPLAFLPTANPPFIFWLGCVYKIIFLGYNNKVFVSCSSIGKWLKEQEKSIASSKSIKKPRQTKKHYSNNTPESTNSISKPAIQGRNIRELDTPESTDDTFEPTRKPRTLRELDTPESTDDTFEPTRKPRTLRELNIFDEDNKSYRDK